MVNGVMGKVFLQYFAKYAETPNKISHERTYNSISDHPRTILNPLPISMLTILAVAAINTETGEGDRKSEFVTPI